MSTVALALLLAGSMALAVGTESARAAFPGVNGKIVFVEENYREPEDNGIRLINPDGSGVRTLVRPRIEEYYVGPSLSPSGKRVAYANAEPNTECGYPHYSCAEIFTIDVITRRVTRITDNDQRDARPTWKPDGTRIAFEHERVLPGGERDTDIFVKRSDGSGATVNKTRNPGEDDLDPAWSPDGTEIAYSTGTTGDIVVLDLETGEKRKLTDDGTTNWDYSPSWSPDGGRIVFGSIDYENSYERIVSVSAGDGSGRRVLAQEYYESGFGGISVGSPAYSPDGRRIVYFRGPGDYIYVRPQLFTMNASDGSDKRLLYNAYFSKGGYPYTEDVYLRSPDWGVQPAR